MKLAKTEFAPWLGVFETLRVVDGIPLFVKEHGAELRRAATMLGLNLTLDIPGAQKKLPKRSGRWRWVVTPKGTRALFKAEKCDPVEPIEVSVATVRLGSQNWDARFKTVSYLTHAQARRMARTPEVILLNEHRHVASAAGGNLFWRRGERLFTPAHEAGCRCGVVRGFVLKRRQVEEGHFPLDDLFEADEIFLTNSLKGIVSIRNVEGRPVEAFSSAASLRVEYEKALKKQLSGS